MGVTPAPAKAAAELVRSPATRIYSLDIFRGLTMAVMIFVNDLSSVKGLPWWTYHMDPKISGMTYVDVVFPTFLFIVGMSIPLAIGRRIEQGVSGPRLWAHILLRSFSLVVLGLILANAWQADPKLTGLPTGLWAVIALTGAILFLAVYPKDGPQTRWRIMKYAGLAIVIAALAIFRQTNQAGRVTWLDFGYWEILGLIGRVYLAACILYVPFRKWIWAPPAVFAGLTALNIASRVGMTPLDRIFPYALWPFDSGELPSIAFAGIITYSIFFDPRVARTLQRKVILALGFAAILFAGGWATTPLQIHKNEATPAWCLYCSGIGVVLFLVIYWLADVRGWRSWAAPFKPAGANTLLTYLLPDLFYFGVAGYIALPHRGWPGIVRAFVFTGCILAVSAFLTKKKIRVQL